MFRHLNKVTLLVTVLFLTLGEGSFAADPNSAAPPPAPPAPAEDLRVSPSDKDEAGTLPEKVDVQTMKRRYWTVGNEDLMSVVQNRLYTKKHRAELSLSGGFYSDDPFMSYNTATVRLGYHLNETWSLHGFYTAIKSSYSSAYVAAKRDAYTPVVNNAKSLLGAEAHYSAIYGKLSVLGKSIIYYDFNLVFGAAQVKANGGTSFGPVFGLGQQIFVSKKLFFTTEYRLLYHSESYPVVNPNDATKSAIGTRTLWTNVIQLGIGTFL